MTYRNYTIGLCICLATLIAGCANEGYGPDDAVSKSQALDALFGKPVDSAKATPKLTAGIFESGDKVIWLGDSITVAHTYGRFVEVFFQLRYPELDINFINAGIGGHSALNGLQRLQEDVIAKRPSVVVINFGMNDAGYPAGSPHADFMQNMQTIIAQLRKSGVRKIVWVEPTPTDYVRSGASSRIKSRQRQLERLVKQMQQQPVADDLVVVQWLAPVTASLKSMLNRDGSRMIPDRIHPNSLGHAVMAAEFLRQVGVDVEPTVIESTLSADTMRTSYPSITAGKADRREISTVIDRGITTVNIAEAVAPVPMVLDSKEIEALSNPTLSDLTTLSWKVLGATATKQYKVSVNDFTIGLFTGEQLSQGINLLAQPSIAANAKASTDLSVDECTNQSGMIFVTDFNCLFQLNYQKDQLNMLMRHRRVRDLPEFGAIDVNTYIEFMSRWLNSVNIAIDDRARARRLLPHTLKLEPVN